MAKISGADLRELSRLFDEAYDLSPAAREAWFNTLPPPVEHLKTTLREWCNRKSINETDYFLEALPVIPVSPPDADAWSASDLAVDYEVGGYRLLRELGKGGMSSVWLATKIEGEIKRPVALKLPYSHLLRAQIAERFARERDILAGLTHRNIARLYDAGVSESGQPYLAMEYVDGVDLGSYCDAHRLGPGQRVQLFLQVVAAVQYAHSRLVLHRDLKPSNILVTADGVVMLLDFGIAKLVVDGAAHATELTQLGGRALTPAYASPEQITGVPLSTASDVYSLGVILYELLCGCRPYRLRRDSLGALEDAILTAESPRLNYSISSEHAARCATSVERLAKQLRGDLDAIVLKALKKNPRERYATVDALAQDLEAYLAGQPVSAQADSASYRLRKFVSRHRLGVGMVAALLLAIAAGVTAVLWQAHQTALQAARAEATKKFLVDIFKASDPRVESDTPRGQITARELLDRGRVELEKRFASAPETEIELLDTITEINDALGEKEHVLELNERKIELASKYFGALSDPVISGYVTRATYACEAYDWPRCQSLLAAADDMLNRAHKNGTSMRADWYLTEATRLRGVPDKEQERLDTLLKAASLYNRVAPKTTSHVIALNELGTYYYEAQQPLRSVDTFKQAIALNNSLPERNDAQMQEMYADMAVSYGSLGAYSEALDALDRAAAIGDRTVGADFRTRWPGRSYRATLLFDSGKRDEAEAEWQKLLALIPPAEKHDSDADVIRLDYGLALVAGGDVAAGVPLLEIALRSFKVATFHPRMIALTQMWLGQGYDGIGKPAAAREELKAGFEYYTKTAKQGSFVNCNARERWARFLLKQGDLEQADEQLKIILTTAQEPASQPVILARADAARIALARHDVQTALQESAIALDTWPKRVGRYDVRFEPYLQRIRADALAAAGNINEAQALEDAAFNASEAYDAPQSPTRVHRTMRAGSTAL